MSTLLRNIALIIIELYFKQEKNIGLRQFISSYKNAALIGLVQSISVVPRVSRSAASIIGEMLFGMDRKVTVEFSFPLAIPTLLVATELDLVDTNSSFNSNEWVLFFWGGGFLSSFVVALLTIKWLILYVQKYSFIPFGVYGIIIAIFLASLLFLH